MDLLPACLLKFVFCLFVFFLLRMSSRLSLADAAETDSKLGKLRLFTTHVRRTMTRMRAARSGRDPLSIPQLALLEEHITTFILPVKARLVRQLEGGGLGFPVSEDSVYGAYGGGSTQCGSSSQIVSQDEISAGGGSTSRSSSVSSSLGGLGENLSQGGEEDGGGGEEGDACAVGMELDDQLFGVSFDATGGGGGGGPKSLDASHDSRSSSLRCWSGGDSVAGRLIQHRRDQLDLLSQLEAEGVFAADDSYSPCRIDVTGDLLPLVVPIGILEGEEPGLAFELAHAKTAADNGEAGARRVTRHASPSKVKQESGTGQQTFNPSAVKEELSDEAPSTSLAQALHVSQAFMGPMVTTTAAPHAASQAEPSSTETTGLPLKAPAEQPATAGGVPPKHEQRGPEGANASTTGVVGNVFSSHEGNAPVVATGRPVVPGADNVVAVGAAPVCASGAVIRAAGHTVAAVVRADTTLYAAGSVAGSGGVAIPPNPPRGAAGVGGAGGGTGGMLVMPPRPAKRRRSSAFAAALLQPREVRYQCGCCSESYASTVTGNPWWLLVRQECPMCHKMQIPRVDILNPTNNVEGHIALLTEACAEVRDLDDNR